MALPNSPLWTTPAGQPKRQHTFLLVIGDIPAWVIKSVSRPSITNNEATYKFMQHTFKFPGQTTFSDITVKCVDRLDVDVSRKLMQMLLNAGYVTPNSPEFNTGGYKKTLSKAGFIGGPASLGEVKIQLTHPVSGNVVEEWVLKNAWIKSLEFGEATYDADGLLEYTMTLAYDWAEFKDATEEVPIF